MKIIHLVLGKANPERMNGVNKVAYQLATTQTALGFDVMLWGIANNLEINYAPRQFKTQLFQQYTNKWRLDSQLIEAIKQLPKNTIIHIHGAFIPTFYRLSRLLKKQEIAYIFTPHGSFTEMAMSKNKWLKKWYFHYFETSLIRDAKRIQLLGIHEYEYLDQLTQEANKCLIPNGQDFSVIPDSLAKGSKNPVIVFGFCGRLATFHKGLDLMLMGFQKYLQSGRTGWLEFIGDGDDRADLEQLSKELGVEDRVVFHGKKFGAEKFALLNKMDVFLHTSRMEGFPTAVLEAAAMHKPTITSEATNINDFVKKYQTGWTLQDNTPEEIAEVMRLAKQAFVDQQLEGMGERGKQMVKQEFDWKNIAQQLVAIYAA